MSKFETSIDKNLMMISDPLSKEEKIQRALDAKSFSYDNHTLTIESQSGLEDFLLIHRIKREDFNIPTIIADTVISCDYMFKGCSSFNQPVVIPNSVTSCKSYVFSLFKI